MELITHESVLIASVISAVVAGHRLRSKALALFVCSWILIFLIISPIGFGALSWIGTVVIIGCFAVSVFLGKLRIEARFGKR